MFHICVMGCTYFYFRKYDIPCMSTSHSLIGLHIAKYSVLAVFNKRLE